MKILKVRSLLGERKRGEVSCFPEGLAAAVAGVPAHFRLRMTQPQLWSARSRFPGAAYFDRRKPCSLPRALRSPRKRGKQVAVALFPALEPCCFLWLQQWPGAQRRVTQKQTGCDKGQTILHHWLQFWRLLSQASWSGDPFLTVRPLGLKRPHLTAQSKLHPFSLLSWFEETAADNTE